jgi:hypothetical protein
MRRTWVILLLIALLPLRVWAAAGMAAAPSMQPQQAEASMPCHAPYAGSDLVAADAAEEGGAYLGDKGAQGTQGAHACASCSLCHAGMAAPAVGLAQPGPAPHAGPLVAHYRDTGRLWVASLERPPRA